MFELNFGQPLLNQILNWINFCRNSNFELNRNGYRLGLPPDKHHRSQHYDVTEKFLAVAIVLNCIKWYWFLDPSNRRSEFISTTRGHRWPQKAELSTKWDIVIIIEREREQNMWFPASLLCIVNWQANTCGADVCLGNTNTAYWGSFEREGPLGLWIFFSFYI